MFKTHHILLRTSGNTQDKTVVCASVKKALHYFNQGEIILASILYISNITNMVTRSVTLSV